MSPLPERIGSFRIERELGRGSQAIVYLAEDTRLNREVALKIFPGCAGGDEAAVRRVLREAKVAARFDHPGICAVYEVGVAHGQPFIAMKHVPGSSLARVLDGWRRAPADLERRIERSHFKKVVTVMVSIPQPFPQATRRPSEALDLRILILLMERRVSRAHIAKKLIMERRVSSATTSKKLLMELSARFPAPTSTFLKMKRRISSAHI